MNVALPSSVERLVEALSTSSGVEAVTLGGSRAIGVADATSDWDLGVFYRGTPDLSVVSAIGELHPPGSWGRFMNGGAWLEIDGHRVDVLLRDLETVEHWSVRARSGDYEVDQLLGHIAGFPSYTLLAEVALSPVLVGRLDIDPSFPGQLASVAVWRWGFQRDFSIDYARKMQKRGNQVGVIGNLARAVMEEGHRRVCSSHQWVLNEKRLLESTDLAAITLEPSGGMSELIDRVERALMGSDQTAS